MLPIIEMHVVNFTMYMVLYKTSQLSDVYNLVYVDFAPVLVCHTTLYAWQLRFFLLDFDLFLLPM